MVRYSAGRDGQERKIIAEVTVETQVRYDTPFNKPQICIFMDSDRSRDMYRRKLHCVKCGMAILDTSADPKYISDAPPDGALKERHYVEVRCPRSGCSQHYRIFL